MPVFSGDMGEVVEIIETREPAAAHHFFEYNQPLCTKLIEGRSGYVKDVLQSIFRERDDLVGYKLQGVFSRVL